MEGNVRGEFNKGVALSTVAQYCFPGEKQEVRSIMMDDYEISLILRTREHIT